MRKEKLTPKHLLKYQKYVAKQVINHPNNFLAIPMGLGKTIMMLTAIKHLYRNDLIKGVLVIAPKLVAETTWPDEIDDWTHTSDLTYEVLTGSAQRRETRALMPANIHIINRENIPWLVEFMGDDWKWDMVVVDESSSFKNYKTKIDPTKKMIAELEVETRFDLRRKKRREMMANGNLGKVVVSEDELLKELAKRIKELPPRYTRFGALANVVKSGKITRMNLLSGTPAPNGLEDLWAQMFLLDQGKALGKNVTQFRNRWFKPKANGFGFEPLGFAFKEIVERMQPLTIYLRAEDYVELPPIVYNTVKVKLPKNILEQYKDFERTLFAEEYDVEASSKGILVNKALQFANGSLYREDEPPVRIHNVKLDALERIIEEAAGEPVLVAYSYEFDKEEILKRFKQAIVLNEEADVVVKWNKGEIPLLITHPASAAHGLNLQHGGHISVWYGFNYSLELYQQFNKRLDRRGQKNKVIIHHIVAEDTIDERCMIALQNKAITQQEFLEAMRVDVCAVEPH